MLRSYSAQHDALQFVFLRKFLDTVRRSWWERQPVALRPAQLVALATTLGVSTDYLLGIDPTKKRGSGPTGKARRVFEAVSKLPRHQQQKIIDVVETFVAGHANAS